jgi:hypothetical protein
VNRRHCTDEMPIISSPIHYRCGAASNAAARKELRCSDWWLVLRGGCEDDPTADATAEKLAIRAAAILARKRALTPPIALARCSCRTADV